MTNTTKRLFLYSAALFLIICITIYSKERRKHVQENSYVTVINRLNSRESVLVLTKFNTNDVILIQKGIQLINLILNTNYNHFTYTNFYWCDNAYDLAYTLYYDIKPQKERGIILISYKNFPPRSSLFYSADITEYASSIIHELHHYYYLSTEQEMENLEDLIAKRKIELIGQKITNSPNPKIKNKLDALAYQVGLGI